MLTQSVAYSHRSLMTTNGARNNAVSIDDIPYPQGHWRCGPAIRLAANYQPDIAFLHEVSAEPRRFQRHFLCEASTRSTIAATCDKDDDDFGQAGALVRDVMDDAQRERLVSNVVGHLKAGVTEPVLERALTYWHNVDEEIGNRITRGVKGT